MALLKPSCIRDLRTRVSVVDVIGRVVTLKKAGPRYKGLCPFHGEKSPSFHVNPDMGVYKCFGCGKSGDLITFVRETEGLSFIEAVETLAQRFQVPLEYEEGRGPSREERSLRQELFDLHQTATAYYHDAFRAADPTGDWMRRYWTESRHFAPELADEFKIGAAPAADTGLAAALLKKKYSEDALRSCGLLFLRDNAIPTLGTLRPRFRGRLIIPIRDHQGRVVAFTARQTELTPADDPAREAKYVNSPETPIFTKSHLLFNLDRARTVAGPDHPFVLVEGQLDALRAWSVGLKTAVAPQGTSITDNQLALLRRYHTQVECFFDSDSAGQKAALRFLPLALKAGLEVRFLTPTGDGKLDPDLLFLEKGLAGYAEVRRDARSAMAFACQALLPAPATAGAEEKTRAAQALFDIVAATETEVARSEFLNEAARHLGLNALALTRDFASFNSRASRGYSAPPLPAADDADAFSSTSAAHPPERDLLLVILLHENLGKTLCRRLPHAWIDGTHPAGALLNRFLAEFESDAWPGRHHLDPLLETDAERALLSNLLFAAEPLDDPVKVLLEGLTQLRQRALEPRLREIELALATSQNSVHFDAFSLLKERSALQRQLRETLSFVSPA